MTDSRIGAARRALETHDALQRANEAEPPCDSDGMPLNPSEWQSWYDGTAKPAYAAWSDAMDALDAATGERIRRHPFTFRPYCAEVLGSARLAHDLDKIYTVLP